MPIRLRLAVLFTVGAAILFSLAAWLFVAELSSALLGSIDAQLTADLSQAGRLVTTPGRGAGRTLPVPGQVVMQVYDASGHLVGATPDSGDTALLSAGELRRARLGSVALSKSLEDEAERVVAAPFRAHPGWVAAAGTSLATYDHTLSDVETALVAAGIAVLVLAGAGAYGLGRSALAPVERLRKQAAEVSEHGQGPALPVPSTRDEIAALARTLNEIIGRLRQSLARQRAFVADAGHELRTPFAVLQGELELASRPGREPDAQAAAMSRAANEASRLTRLANDLLMLARNDAEQLDVRRADVKVADWLDSCAAGFASRAGEAGVTIDVQADDELMGHFDPDRVRQAVDNLLDNALRFAPRGSAIVVRAERRQRDLVIEVSDGGPGFPSEYLDHAFERFSRPDSGRARSSGGAGLGLAIVEAIATAHGGHATARNDAAGAVATVVLPDEASPSA